MVIDEDGRDYSLAEAARKIGIRRETLSKLCDRGEVAHRVALWNRNRKLRRISAAEIERLKPRDVNRRGEG